MAGRKHQQPNSAIGSLCWQCRKAGGGQGCCWIDETPSGSVPVPGWTVTARKATLGHSKDMVYTVQNCPQFEEG